MHTLAPILAILDAGVHEGVAPAMNVAILVHGKLIHQSWHGQAALFPAPRKLSKHDLFDVASLTKVLCTTTLAALLVDNGALKLESCVTSYFAQATHLQNVTVRHLLSHTSGLAAYKPYYELVLAQPIDGYEKIHKAVLSENLEATPGERVLYSDIGFIILGFIIEKITGESLDVSFAKLIAQPLQLKRTFFIREGSINYTKYSYVATEQCEHRKEVNCGSVNDDNAWALDGVAGHAGLFSDAYDVVQIGQSWLNALQGKSSILKRNTASLFAKRDNLPGSTRALGWDTPSLTKSSIGNYLGRGLRGAIGHLGFTGTSLWIDIDNEIICVLLTNRVHPFCDNQMIKEFRIKFHDAIAEVLNV